MGLFSKRDVSSIDSTMKETEVRKSKRIKEKHELRISQMKRKVAMRDRVPKPQKLLKIDLNEITLIFSVSSSGSFIPQEVMDLLTNMSQSEEEDADDLLEQTVHKFMHEIKEETEEFTKSSYIQVIKKAMHSDDIRDRISMSKLLKELTFFLTNEADNRNNIFRADVIDCMTIMFCHRDSHSTDLGDKEVAQTVDLIQNILLSGQKTNHLVRRNCLLLMGEISSSEEAISILKDFTRNYDSRIRSAALTGLLRMDERQVSLSLELYEDVSTKLRDDYECCRINAMRLLVALSKKYSETEVSIRQGEEKIRLVDDSFAKICNMMSDISIHVRTEAASLLGEFTTVSSYFLNQTLNKTLMSNLRKKQSSHERNRTAAESGLWSSGRKWADDAPQERICPDEVNLMEMGAAGAFIHGLEDEFLEVRMATLDSLGRLSQLFHAFGRQSVDFLVDMFNDEIQEIRLKAIHCLSSIMACNRALRDDQVTLIVAAFEENSMEIREALYEMLSNSRVDSTQSLSNCIKVLHENLKRYPEDKMDIWRCLQKLGQHHPKNVSSLVTNLLAIHPFLSLKEPSIEDQDYVANLILIFNAASLESSIIPKLESYTEGDYSYLRSAHPDYMPFIPGYVKDVSSSCTGYSRSTGPLNKSHPSLTYLYDVFRRLRSSVEIDPIEVQTTVIDLSIQDLERLGQVEQSVKVACNFLVHYLNCQLSIRKILINSNWINALIVSPLQSSIFRSSLQQILVTTFNMIHGFQGIHPQQSALIQQTRVKALALQLMAIIHGSNTSALSLTSAFLSELDHLEKTLCDHNIRADPLTEAMIGEVSKLEESPKPGTIDRVLKPLFLSTDDPVKQFADLSQMVCDETIHSLMKLTVSRAEIQEPLPRSDAILKFGAGLILSVRLHSLIHNIRSTKMIRIKVKYPDQKIHYLVPRLSDFREMKSESKDVSIRSYRLDTNVYLSHTVWSEPAPIEITVCMDCRTSESSVSQLWAMQTGRNSGVIKNVSEEDMLIFDLCKAIKINIHPKPINKHV